MLRRRLLSGIVPAVIALSIGGCAPRMIVDASDAAGVPVPHGASRISVFGEVGSPGAHTVLYVMKPKVKLRAVTAFYRDELPAGDDFGDWEWCGKEAADHRRPLLAWQQDGRVLSVTYYRQGRSTLLDIPPRWIVLLIVDQPADTAGDDFPGCAPAA